MSIELPEQKEPGTLLATFQIRKTSYNIIECGQSSQFVNFFPDPKHKALSVGKPFARYLTITKDIKFDLLTDEEISKSLQEETDIFEDERATLALGKKIPELKIKFRPAGAEPSILKSL